MLQMLLGEVGEVVARALAEGGEGLRGHGTVQRCSACLASLVQVRKKAPRP